MCIMLDSGILKSNIMCSLIADILSLLIMLIGLFRLPLGEGDAFGLERILWNQVRWLRFSLWCSKFTDVIFCLKGHHLALACHNLRDPSNNTFVYSVVPFLLAHLLYVMTGVHVFGFDGSFLSLQPINDERRLIFIPV